MENPPKKAEAFAKGGCGCLAAFALVGLLVLLAGGRVRADLFGLVFLFVAGGITGLVVLAIYNRGRRDADRDRK